MEVGSKEYYLLLRTLRMVEDFILAVSKVINKRYEMRVIIGEDL